MSSLPVTFSALPSDVQRDPSILQGMELEAWSRTVNVVPHGRFFTVTDGAVITVTAVEA